MDSCFEKWWPFPLQDTMYDLQDLSIGKDGFTFFLRPDGIRRTALSTHTVTLVWASVERFQVTDERYCEDCWCRERREAWPFFRATESPWLADLRKTSPLVPANTVHYRLVGTNLVVDILADRPPRIILT